jgi:hypothetical protein
MKAFLQILNIGRGSVKESYRQIEFIYSLLIVRAL